MTSPCCVTGELHDGTPAGHEEKLHELDCYISDPPSGKTKGTIVIFPDIFGWKLPNSRILADQYAERSQCRVLLPDWFNGASVPYESMQSIDTLNHATGFMGHLKNFRHWAYIGWNVVPVALRNLPGSKIPIASKFLKDLRNADPDLKIGVAGFCWGGKIVLLLAGHEEKPGDKPLIDCGFTAHPSMVSVPSDIEKVNKPLSVACAGTDQALSKEQADQIRQILETKGDAAKYEYVMYDKAYHGFAVRGSKDDPEENKLGQQAEDQAVAFFQKWLTHETPKL